jgi:hypothetical protein
MSETELDVTALSDEQLQGLLDGGDEPTPEEAAPEPTPEPVAEEPEHKPEPKHVPLAELLEERGRRKEAQARLEEMERRFGEWQARAQQAMQQQTQPQAEQPPAYEDDPLGAIRFQQEQLARHLQATQQHLAQSEAQRQQQAQFAALREAVGQAEKEFAGKTPDYYEAVSHLRDTRVQQLAAQGLPPQAIEQAIVRDTLAVAQEARNLGLNPAEYAYRIALGSGWQAKPKAAPTPPAEAPKSLGGASGRAEASGTPSLEDISRMNDKEFDALFAKLMVGT